MVRYDTALTVFSAPAVWEIAPPVCNPQGIGSGGNPTTRLRIGLALCSATTSEANWGRDFGAWVTPVGGGIAVIARKSVGEEVGGRSEVKFMCLVQWSRERIACGPLPDECGEVKQLSCGCS